MNTKNKKNLIKYILGSIILILLMALTYYVIFNEFDVNEILRQIKDSSNKQYFFIAGLMSVLYLAFYGRFSQIGIKAFGEKTNAFKCFIYGCADYFYAVITPTASGGQPAVMYFMAKDKIPFPKAGAIVIVQTIFYKVVLLLYNVLSIIFISDIIKTAGTLFSVMLAFGALLSVIGVVLCLISMYKTSFVSKIGVSCIKLLGKIKILRHTNKKTESFTKVLNDYNQASHYIKGKRLMLIRMFIAIFLQRSAMFLIAFFVYKSFGLGEFNFFFFIFIQASIELAIVTIPIPGYIGISEYAIFLFNSRIYANDEIMAVAAMLLIRVFSYYFTFFISSVFTLGKHVLVYFSDKKLKT